MFSNINRTQAAEIDLYLQTRPYEFVANPFSGSQDILYTNKKSQTTAKTEPCAVHFVQ